MSLILLWITTIVMSKTIDVITACKVIKDLASEEYKIKPDNFDSLSMELNNNENNTFNKIKTFIPFFNMYNSMLNGMNYAMNKGGLLDQLYLMDAIERMDKDEIEEYNKKPSAINALIIANRDKKKIDSYKPLFDESKSKAICVDYEKENKLRLLLLYHNLDRKGKIKIDEIRIEASPELIKNKEEYDTLLKSEVKRIHKLSTKRNIILDKYIRKIYKCKHKEYMSIGETVVKKEFESKEENIKNKGEKFDADKLNQIRREKEKLIREKNDLLNETHEEELKLEKRKK